MDDLLRFEDDVPLKKIKRYRSIIISLAILSILLIAIPHYITFIAFRRDYLPNWDPTKSLLTDVIYPALIQCASLIAIILFVRKSKVVFWITLLYTIFFIGNILPFLYLRYGEISKHLSELLDKNTYYFYNPIRLMLVFVSLIVIIIFVRKNVKNENFWLLLRIKS
jgi:hypothetical protein